MLAAAPMSTGGYLIAYVVLSVALFSLVVIARDPRLITPRRAMRGVMKPWEENAWRVAAGVGIVIACAGLIALTADALK
jgi:hypothetical protein